MRKQFHLLSIALFFLFNALSLVAVANSFQVADPGFENWSQSFNGQPALGGGSTGANTGKGLWYGSNVYKDVGLKVYGQVVHRTEGRSGYAAKLVDTEVGALGITEVSPSWVTLGTPWSYIKGTTTSSATAGTDGGIKFTHRPDTMAVWVKRDASKGAENINLVYYAWKGQSKGSKYKNKGQGCQSTGAHYDEESDIRRDEDPNTCGTEVYATHVADGFIRTPQTFSNWTQIKVPIVYKNDLVPEKMNIILSASPYPEGRRTDGLHKGNYLIVDDLSLIYSSKIHELRLGNEPLVNFDANQYHYTIELGEKATINDVPDIICKRSGRTLSGSEIVVNKATELEKPTTITVKAEDGSSTTVYTVTFVRKRSSNSRINNIFIEGVPVTSFSGYVTDYTVDVPYGLGREPVITVEKAEEAQTVEIVNCGTFPCTAKVIVTAANPAYSTVYTLKLQEGALSDNTLQDILINGNSIPGFKPTTNAYTVELPLGTTQDPTIEAVSKYADGDQDIKITNNGLNGRSTIVVTPPAGDARTYRISYVITESSYSYLKDLQVGGVSVADFDPETTQYNVTLPVGTTTLPAITWTQGDPYQTVKVENEGVEGTSRITVTAQNGNVTIYRIVFSVEKSAVSTLNNIMVDGVALPNFDPQVTDYTYNVNAAAISRPVVTWQTADAYQTVLKNPTSEAAAPIEGTTKLTVRAQNGNTTVYSIEFTQKLSDNAKLADLQVEGYSLSPAFNADVTDYTCGLKRGTTAVPAITFVKGDETQVVRIDEYGVNGTTKVTVKAQTGTTMVYNIAFSVATSSDATLQDIVIGGVSLEGFAPATLVYDVLLPSGTTVLPTIEAVKNDAAQRVAMIKGGVNGTTTIKVVAEDGTELTYQLNFAVEKSLNANLQNIYVGGEPLANFDPNVMMYRYVLAENMAECPIVKAIGYPGQTITTTQPKLAGTARIEVQPEEGAKNVYTIDFVRNMSNNCLLKNMMVNGKDFGFTPEVNDYTIAMPEGTTVVPTVTYSKGEDKQTVQVISGGLNGTTQVVVIAEDGTNNVYEIHFSVAQSAQAQLQGIAVDGQLLTDFDPATLEYTYTLPYGTTTLPTVTYQSQKGQHVSLLLPQLEGDAVFVVTAEDGSSSATYKVNFQVAQLGNANLQNILVNGVALANFAPTEYDYVIDYVKGQPLPVVTYQKDHATQQVVVNNQGLNGCTLTVTAQNGNQQMYNLAYNVLNNQVALLSDIQLYNAQSLTFTSLEGFSAEQLEYNVVLPWRTQVLPVIKPVAASKGQVITMQEGGVNGATTITVLADDGITTATYTIRFSVAQSNDATLSNIMVNDNDLEGFDPTVFTYEVSLPYGTTQMPKIAFENAYKEGQLITEQQVIVTNGGLYGVTTLQVTSQDGSATNTYQLTFTIQPTDKPNTLTSIVAGTVQVPLMEGLFNYNITLPYGTTELPDLTIVKNYPEQEVKVVKEGTPYGFVYSVTVLANMPNVGQTLYRINCQIDKSTTTLSGITLNNGATLYPAYKPDVYQYVAVIKEKSDLVLSINEDKNKITYPATEQATNKIVAVVTSLDDKTDVKRYTFYLHYKDDVIPNGDFTSWSKAKYHNADKPTGWKVPADSKDTYRGTTKTGKEVVKTDNTTVGLKSTYWAAIAGTIPPVMTLGDLELNFAAAAGSKVSINGGILFRNSPDFAQIKYNYAAREEDSQAQFSFSFDGEKDDYVTSSLTNKYIEYTHKLKVSGKSPSKMNIVVNATNSLGSKYYWRLSANDQLYVDYIKFAYSSEIKSVKVNGVEATKTGNSFNATIDPEYVGFPQLEFTGEVVDQAYEVIWNMEYDGVRTAQIRAFAEDGSYTNYELTVNRQQSTNNQLKQLSLEGVDFTINPTLNNYSIQLPVSVRQLPNITVAAKSHYATVSVQLVNILNSASTMASLQQNNKSTYIVTVTSETGANNMYTIVVDKEYSTDATLKDIAVEGYELTFTPDVETYTVSLPAGTTEWPAVTYQKQSDGQTVTLTMGTTTTLLVTAEDGTTQKTYTINFEVAPTVTSAQLVSLTLADGNALSPDFAKDTYTYTCEQSSTAHLPILYQREFAADHVTVVMKDALTSIYVTNGEVENTYSIARNKVASTNALLQTILVNNEPIHNFSTQEVNYEVVAQDGMVYDVQPVLAEEGQSMTITFDATTQTYSIVVLAADATTSQTYTVKLVAPINNNADLAAIEVGGTLLPEFDKDKVTYSYTIPCSVPKWEEPIMPHVRAVGAGANQTISIENNGINGKTYINVTAQSGVVKTYEIAFEAQKSDYVYLKNIFKNCEALTEFYPTLTDYTFDVPVTVQRPVISYEAGDAFQQITEVEEANKHSITVTAQSGDSFTYTINFNRTYSKNALLNGITLDGELLPGFVPTTYEYNFELPVGTTVLPKMGVISGADGQTTQITTNGVNGDAVILVTADDNETTVSYTIHFTVDKSQVNTLLDIQLDGTSIEGFDAHVYEYTHTLPVGTRTWPLVSWTAGDAYQIVTMTETEVDTWNKVITLVAQPEDETIESTTYTINLVVEKSALTTLKDIQLDYVSYVGFEPETENYTIELPIGTKQYPEVTYTPGDEFQQITQVVEDNKVFITVVAENGDNRTYQLEFVVLHSNNASLASIAINYEPLAGFSPDVLEYHYELPWGTTQMPVVTYEMGDMWQTVTATDNGVNGDYLLHVKAEDGDTEQTYVIHFSVALSNNALLSDLLVGESSMPNFDAEIFTYQYDLPYGETVVPAISGVKAMETQTVEVVNATTLTEQSTITVTAEDGKTQKVYTVTWGNAKSDNTQLKMIYLDGVALEKYQPTISDYSVALPYGTTQLPVITWEAGDADQTITLDVTDNIAIISVQAQDGTYGEYYLTFTVKKSDENRLKNIYLKGKALEGFNPEQVEYKIIYPTGTNPQDIPTLQDVTYEVFDPIEQVTLVEDGSILMLRVMAENGDVRTYVIAQSIALSSNTQLESILVNGKELSDFYPDQLEYTYILPFGSVAVPTDITYVQAEETQSVVVSINPIGMPTEIFVTAQDGTKEVYRIHFMVDDFDPSVVPTADNVCITSLPNGKWKFTTNCYNMIVYLVTLDGKVISTAPLPLVDVNVPNICSEEAEGFIYEAGMDNVVAYYFMHNMKYVVASGKFRVSHQ